MSSSHGVYIPDSTMEEGRTNGRAPAVHAILEPSRPIPLLSHQPEPSHMDLPSHCLLPVPNRLGEMVLLLYLPGRLTASGDFTIHFCFQVVPTAGESDTIMLTCGFQPSLFLNMPVHASLVHASWQFFQVSSPFLNPLPTLAPSRPRHPLSLDLPFFPLKLLQLQVGDGCHLSRSRRSLPPAAHTRAEHTVSRDEPLRLSH